jgi:hypothetical protein
VLSIHSHAERPELENQKWSSRVNLPEFLFHAVGPDDIPARLLTDFPEFQLYCFDGSELVGIAHSIPIKWNGTDDGLPAGWTETLEHGLERDAMATDLAALRVDIRRDRQQTGVQPSRAAGAETAGSHSRPRSSDRPGSSLTQISLPAHSVGEVREMGD